MRFAVGLPNLHDYAEPGRLVALAQAAESSGWDGCFIWDHLAYRDPPAPAADPQIVLGAIAVSTSRISFGALLTPLARRRPSKVARETATLDVLSGGRLVFGAALGWSGEEEFEDLGEPGDARVRADKLDEGLAVLDALWSGEAVDFAGEHYTVRDTRFTPRPLQRPRIPVWIGGGWPARRPFRRAARWDGVFPILKGIADDDTMPPDQLREIVAYTNAHRPPGRTPLDVILEGNSAGDRPALADYEAAGLTWYIEKLGWWSGSVDEVTAVIRRGPPRR
jgi:alkanesulfonate monooxygenase SsuD/methylene tetrahydromethanopterin reductase-like flavin-dependent oxidoreductase (luciferase family)